MVQCSAVTPGTKHKLGQTFPCWLGRVVPPALSSQITGMAEFNISIEIPGLEQVQAEQGQQEEEEEVTEMKKSTSHLLGLLGPTHPGGSAVFTGLQL